MPTSDTTTDARFDEFVTEARPRLVRAFVPVRGIDGAHDAAAEALAFAFEHWDRVEVMANPVGYLYRVGQSRTRSRMRPRLPRPESVGVPEVEPGLVEALGSLTVEQQLVRYGRAVEDRATDSTPDLPVAGDRGADRRWFPAAAALIVVLAAAAALVALVDRGPERSEQVVADTDDAGEWSTHLDPILGWQVEVPPGWRVIEFEESCWQGFAVVNHDTEPTATRPHTAWTDGPPSCSTDPDRFAPEPDQAAIVVYRFTGSMRFSRPVSADTTFPLSMPETALRGTVSVVADGEWTGLQVRHAAPRAPSEDRDLAQAVMASLIPPWIDEPLAGGTAGDGQVGERSATRAGVDETELGVHRLQTRRR